MEASLLKNSAYCDATCSSYLASVNSCQPDSLLWNCECTGKALPISFHCFPIQVQQCAGDVAECKTTCLSTSLNQMDAQSCSQNCDSVLMCNTISATETRNFTGTSNTNAINQTVANVTNVIGDSGNNISGSAVICRHYFIFLFFSLFKSYFFDKVL